jgi:hypothetical protein
MNRRYFVYLGVIAFLVLVLLGRWWMDSGAGGQMGTGESAARGKVLLPEDFRLRVDFPVASEPRRDLFQPKGSASLNTNHVRQARFGSATLPPVPLGANEAEAADSGLSRLKLLGVVFRAGKAQVYLALNKENVIAHAGDTVLGQFAVDKVAIDAVELRDLKTNTIRRIPVSGK